MPQLWVVAGPNGAGKTTVADRWLTLRVQVVSPDSIAVEQGISPVQAGKAAIREQDRLLKAGESFAIDTTFSGNRELALMKRATEAGYKVNLIFVCVENTQLCQGRIIERVESGGHAVPSEDIVRRYSRSLKNLTTALDMVERVFILDNTGKKRRLLLSVENGKVKHLSNNLPQWAKDVIPERFVKSRSLGLGLGLGR